ncbi:MAG TPA: cupin domain-containing protein [Longimicrobiaceae bacterium]|nr:cupin domain-containing protein [Longimicrobiaceae bacterium]
MTNDTELPGHPRAAELVRRLELRPHPEGGWYREVFRSPHTVRPDDGRPPRSALTVIHFLLAGGGHSRWHRVASDEAWSWVEGDPLELMRILPDGVLARVRLGAPGEGAEPVAVVPAGEWQAARTLGAYTLVACAVGPGFDFADFAMLADAPAEAEAVRRRHPDAAALI